MYSETSRAVGSVSVHEPSTESLPSAARTQPRSDRDFLNGELFCNTTDLVDRIRRGERGSIEDLCGMLRISAYCQLMRRVERQCLEDKFHDVVVTVLEAIASGALKRPDRLMGFVHTIARRGVAAQIRANIKSRRCTSFEESDFARSDAKSPEATAAQSEKLERLDALLNLLRPRDRDLLIRFYLYEQSPAQICLEMHLTATQFRLYKSRALARCAATAAGPDNLLARPI